MRKLFLSLTLLFYTGIAATAQNNVGINNPNPAASAALDVTSTTQGMLVPRMDSAQRSQIATPATGLLVYQTNGVTPGFYFYNGTAWTSLNNGGGTALPSQTGNAGKVLTTDGTNLSWGSGVGASYEVYATITTAQTTSVGSSLTLPDAIYFSANTTPAVLTGSNTFTNVTVSSPNTASANANQTASKFTASTAGLYFVDIQLCGDPANGVANIPMLDINGGGITGTSYYGTAYANTSTLQNPYKGRGTLQRLVYLNANDNFIVRVASANQSVGVSFTTNGSSYIKIVKLK